MRRQLSNVLYGVLDYAAYPAAMLLAAPVVLRNLGVEAYGVWAIMTAVVSAGSILAAGFGDANIKHVSEQRGLGDRNALIAAVRALLGLNLLLAVVASASVWLLAVVASHRIVPDGSQLNFDCILSLRLAAILIGLRAVESVCISTQRAYERYGSAVRISVLARLFSLLTGAALTPVVHHVAIIMAVAVAFNAISTWWQFRHLRKLLGVRTLRPAFQAAASRDLFHFGMYSWILAASSILFGQADRLVLGVWLGAAPVAGYALCTQLTQPIYGLAAAGLHFLFPYLANRTATQSPSDLRNATLIAAVGNVLFVVAAAVLVQLLGPRILTWLGRGAFQAETHQLLVPIVWSTALLGLSVTPTYALYAFNRIRLVTLCNVAGAVICLLLMVWLGRSMGAKGIAWARLSFGAVTVLLYLPLLQLLRKPNSGRINAVLCEEA